MKETVIKAAREIVGVERRTQSEWFDDEYQEAIQKKANHVCKKKKREYMKEVRQIEELSEQKKIRNLYIDVRSVNRSYHRKLNICEDEDGKLIAEEKLILDRWAAYFEEILNKPDIMKTEEENVGIGSRTVCRNSFS